MPFTMERREHYDPEDIENLLQERGYDELLEEERAYVLRHLSGREEYEAMRSLLLQVKEDDRRLEPLTADPAIRENVMAAFRAQQQPPWQVWLNSVGALLWPKEASAMWRPALAFASLAALVIVGVQVMRNGPDAVKQQQMAEVRPKPATEQAAAAADSMRATETTPAQARSAAPAQDTQREEAASEAVRVQPVVSEDVADEAPAPALNAMADDAAEYRDAEKALEPVTESLAEREAEVLSKKEAAYLSATPAAAGATSHVVTSEELVTNMSTANASERARVSGVRFKQDSGTTLADAPEVMALLTTGW